MKLHAVLLCRTEILGQVLLCSIMKKCKKPNFSSWFKIYVYYSPKTSNPGDKTGKSHFPTEFYPNQSWERHSHQDLKCGCHQRIPSYSTNEGTTLLSPSFRDRKYSLQLSKSSWNLSAHLFQITANYHSEDLIFIKAQFLFWHRANWLEVLRTVYADYRSFSKSVTVGAASLWTLVKISPHISNISKRFCIWCLALVRAWIWPFFVKIRGFSVENWGWTLWFDSGVVQSLEVVVG